MKEDGRLITKNEALDLLRVTDRALQKYAAQGKLEVRYIRGDSGRKEARYIENEVKKLQEEQGRVIYRPTNSPPNLSEDNSPVPIRPNTPSVLEFTPEVFERFQKIFSPTLPPSEIKQKPILTLVEASTLTGLSKQKLVEAIKAEDLPGAKVGNSWKLETETLIHYARSLVLGTLKVGNE
jgi:excisionase family DNA binding protein